MKQLPFRALCHLSAVRRAAGSDSYEISRPFNGTWTSPMWSAPFQAHSGSVLRFSQPLNGFQASPSFTALFHAAAIRGISPQSFPLTKVAHPSRGRWLPCGYPPCARTHHPSPYRHRFHRRPRFHAVAWIPVMTMRSLFTCRSTLPGRTGARTINRPVPLASSASKLYSLHESVLHQSELPRAGRRCFPELLPL